jgi:DNA polymerase elongation subunit (family B)
MPNIRIRAPRILLYDLETLPDFEEIMRTGVYPRISSWPGVSMRADITSVICFGYKWLGEKTTHCINAWDFKGRWGKNVNDDKALLRESSKILLSADAVITHNGKRFDQKVFQTRLLKWKLPFLHPNIKHIDLCQVAKSKLFLSSNSHNTVSQFIQNEKKMDNGGWDLWYRVWKREVAACNIMTKYCKRDVSLMEPNFEALRPLINNIPNYNLFREDGTRCCPYCGHLKLKSNGLYRTKTTIRRQYRCIGSGGCGAFFTTDANDRMPRSL